MNTLSNSGRGRSKARWLSCFGSVELGPNTLKLIRPTLKSDVRRMFDVVWNL